MFPPHDSIDWGGAVKSHVGWELDSGPIGPLQEEDVLADGFGPDVIVHIGDGWLPFSI
jgi:hypothetical protein